MSKKPNRRRSTMPSVDRLKIDAIAHCYVECRQGNAYYGIPALDPRAATEEVYRLASGDADRRQIRLGIAKGRSLVVKMRQYGEHVPTAKEAATP